VATFVLVHPAWLGGWCWSKVASRLRELRHAVYAPTLTGLGERAHLANPDVGLSTHVEDVASLVQFEDLRDIILVGTSSAGTAITGVADVIPDRISSLIYLDAFLPSDGQCTFDLMPTERRATLEALVETEGDGWLLPRFAPPPWPIILRDLWQFTDESDVAWMLTRLRPTPVRHFTQPVRVTPGRTDAIRRAYIRCTGMRMPAPPFDRAAAFARSTPGWQCVEIDATHLSYVTHPDKVTAALLDLANGGPSETARQVST